MQKCINVVYELSARIDLANLKQKFGK